MQHTTLRVLALLGLPSLAYAASYCGMAICCGLPCCP